EPSAHVPLGIAFLYEPCSNKSMNHVVELSDAHSPFRNPVFPGLDRQTTRFHSLDFLPEVVSFPGKKVALPEDSTEEFLRSTRQVPGLEQVRGGVLGWPSNRSAAQA